LEKLQADLPDEYGVLSLFNSGENLILFWIDKAEFLWKVLPKKEIESDLLQKWTEGIQFSSSASRYRTEEVITRFSKQVLEPFEEQLDQVDELLLIPHGVFNSFPFELLPLPSGQLLLEEKALSYQFSCRFISPVWKTLDQTSMLAFAPFSGIAQESAKGFSLLPGSEKEIEELKGAQFLGEHGTKQVFLEKASKAKIIHLATHAVASSEDPNEAFVAFYPEEDEFRMFAPELAFQNLEGVELVYLSACETGSGKQSSSEGLISLARSFAIAGADQLVISQWVSEDQVSGYLSSRFYQHAEEGNTYSNSLRLAKLDLLADPKMAQFHHPFYWTNYRIIGQPEDATGKNRLFLWVGAILLLAILGSWFAYHYDRLKARA
jgi:CHAT domain-containing protein